MPRPRQAVLAALVALHGCGDRHADAPWRARLATLLTARNDGRGGRTPQARAVPVRLAQPWLVLPCLAAELADADGERAALAAWCAAGVRRATGRAVPVVGDLGAATAVLLVGLWQIATAARLPPERVAAVQAQVAEVLDYPKVRFMPAEDMQCCWELCVGLEAVFAGLLDAGNAGGDAASVRLAAHAALTGLLQATDRELAVGAHGFCRGAADGQSA